MMFLTPQKRVRSGVTLIEVLVAIFVASIGLLALLALFPVGALSMKQALKDSRCAQTSANAMALFKTLKLGQNSALGTLNGLTDPYVDGTTAGPLLLGTRTAASPNGSSYPIFIDPLGASIKVTNAQNTINHLPLPQFLDIATYTYPRILRAGVDFIPSGAAGFGPYEHWFSLLDDINFDPANPGQPGPLGGSFTRDPRYTFAYMVRRPYAGNPSTFDVTIVVYSGRPINAAMGSFEEMACNQVVFTQGSTTVTVPYGTAGVQPQHPIIKTGGWILDASMPSVLDTNVLPQGYFYRVVEVVDNGTSLTLELQTPARQSTTQGMAIFLDNVAEVFEKGTVSLQ